MTAVSYEVERECVVAERILTGMSVDGRVSVLKV